MVTNKKTFSFLSLIRRTGASLFFLGYFPFASGTLGSTVAIAGVWCTYSKWPSFYSPQNILYYWGAMFLLAGISIFLSSKSKEIFGKEDSSRIIIDEVAGQFITFFMIPISWKTLAAGFFLFRFFDIVKPFPINEMQELEGGVGVTMDDVLAGLFANVSLLLILASYSMIKSYLNM
ncbi:MAG: phosphatidylglycerophosphatase A [Fibrobacter sp.]|nr:phosphatidylglycerophosphatase A [Fibrobacter sp.]